MIRQSRPRIIIRRFGKNRIYLYYTRTLSHLCASLSAVVTSSVVAVQEAIAVGAIFLFFVAQDAIWNVMDDMRGDCFDIFIFEELRPRDDRCRLLWDRCQ